MKTDETSNGSFYLKIIPLGYRFNFNYAFTEINYFIPITSYIIFL